MKKSLVFLFVAAFAVLFFSGYHLSAQSETKINPRDTVQVPEGFVGDDSIAYIEDVVVRSPILASDLLSLAEQHKVEDMMLNYGKTEDGSGYSPERQEALTITHRDSAALRLANRFLRMTDLVRSNGNATDRLQWVEAVHAAIDTFQIAVPAVPHDSIMNEMLHLMEKFCLETQMELNFQSHMYSMIDYYSTIEAYMQWMEDAPSDLSELVGEEYKAWHGLNEARFAFWNDVSYRREWYSMKPMEINGYYEYLSSNRRAELEVERAIILDGKPYRQKGKTVSSREWNEWIEAHSVPEDYEIYKDVSDMIPADSVVTNRVNSLKSAFAQWLAARQALAAALPKDKGVSYDNLTADIHSRIIGKLPSIISYGSEY